MDATLANEILYGALTVGALVLIGAGFLIGKLRDPRFYCIQRRNLEKKDFKIVNLVSKDRHTIWSKVVNTQYDMIIYDGYLWMIEACKIYRSANPEFSQVSSKNEKPYITKNGKPISEGDVVNLNPNSMVIDNAATTWREGAPEVFVDTDHLKLLSFFDETSLVKPQEASAEVNAFIANQIAKDKAMNKMTDIIVILVLLGVLAVGYLNYNSSKEISEFHGQYLNSTCSIPAKAIAQTGGGGFSTNAASAGGG